jgi:hypothetical protein
VHPAQEFDFAIRQPLNLMLLADLPTVLVNYDKTRCLWIFAS